SYLYKLIKLNSFQKKKFKIFLILIVVSSVFSQNLFDSTNINVFCLHKREVTSIKLYSNYCSNKNVVITKFGWYAIFLYYEFPFEDKDEEFEFDLFHYFLLLNKSLVSPNMHYSNGTNVLKSLKLKYNTEVILLLPENYYSPFSWTFFDQLSEQDIETYYNLNYLNRIFSSKGENGEELPYYWVI
ncbi:MAG: hypothetical protein ACFFCV_16425, partial [Promethearchaeota archaeon]